MDPVILPRIERHHIHNCNVMKVLQYHVAIPIREQVLIELDLVRNQDLTCFLNVKFVTAGAAISSKTQIYCFNRFWEHVSSSPSYPCSSAYMLSTRTI
jgi:hypothetical protein